MKKIKSTELIRVKIKKEKQFSNSIKKLVDPSTPGLNEIYEVNNKIMFK